MKLILTSAVLAGAGSLVVHANDTHTKLTVPMIIEKSEAVEIEHNSSESNFILVPHSECTIDDNKNLEQSIRECIVLNKTWLKAI
tara:strand:- start:266 stop:520 length:255 start_codon:yes stop_codon:yes gene_type:complete